MKITINKEKHLLKPASQLTVKEYIELFDRIKPGVKSYALLIEYISVITGLPYSSIADITIDEDSLRRCFAYIGEIKNAKELPISKEFYYKKTGRLLFQKKVNWRTVGAISMLEERKEKNQLKLAVYLLAVYLSGNYDAEKTEDIYHELQDYNAIDVFSFIVFFFKKLLNGKKQKANYISKLRRKHGTNTAT